MRKKIYTSIAFVLLKKINIYGICQTMNTLINLKNTQILVKIIFGTIIILNIFS